MQNRDKNRLAVVLVATGMIAGWSSAAQAAPSYSFLTDIQIPVATGNSSGGKFNGFDITAFDGNTQLAYVADRSNNSVDVFSSATDSFLTRIPGFVGVRATNSVSGPDGVAIINDSGQHVLWAGDGNSTAKAFTITGGSPTTAPAFTPLATVNTNGSFRVDEMAYDPKDHRLLVANNADAPPFATLIDTTTNTAVKKITLDGTAGQPNSSGGIEASAYSTKDGVFYLNLVQLEGGSLAGAVAKIDPLTGNTLKVYDLSAFGISDCSPAGISVTTGTSCSSAAAMRRRISCSIRTRTAAPARW